MAIEEQKAHFVESKIAALKEQKCEANQNKPDTTQRFIALFQQNVLSGGTKSLKDMMREAGYAEESVRQ